MNLNQWIIFEERLRKSSDIQTLQLVIVNLLQQVVPYFQAVIFEKKITGYSTTSISNISEINSHSPTIQWLNNKLYKILDESDKPIIFDLNTFGLEIDSYYTTSNYGLYIPVKSLIIGHYGLILWFKTPVEPELLNVSSLINSTIVHSWEKLALQNKSNDKISKHLNKRNVLITSIVVLFLLFGIRINQSTIATAEISPQNPILISSSINGLIKSINVTPNEAVKAEQILFQLDDINIRSQLNEAEEALRVADQKYLKAYKHAYSEEDSRKEMNLLENARDQAYVTYQYRKKLLERIDVTSPISGVVLFSNSVDWLGKPVKIGEKVMLVADTTKKEINFKIQMDNMIEVDKKIPIKFYSNENPMSAVTAQISYINPIAEPQPDGLITYSGIARIDGALDVHLGEQGTVKIFGSKVSLIYYIFRRPFRYFRQQIGV